MLANPEASIHGAVWRDHRHRRRCPTVRMARNPDTAPDGVRRSSSEPRDRPRHPAPRNAAEPHRCRACAPVLRSAEWSLLPEHLEHRPLPDRSNGNQRGKRHNRHRNSGRQNQTWSERGRRKDTDCHPATARQQTLQPLKVSSGRDTEYDPSSDTFVQTESARPPV